MTPAAEPGAGLLAFLSCASAVIAALAAVYVAVRDGRWRKSGLAKQLSDQVQGAWDAAKAAQHSADYWFDTTQAKEMRDKISDHAILLQDHDGILDSVATKEDIARVEGAAKRLESMVEDAAGGIDRIEGILIKKALNGERV